jgi:conjugal transfer pilus assembly protein TraD
MASASPYDFEVPWRPNFEAKMALIWAGGSALILVFSLAVPLFSRFAALLAVGCALAAAFRGCQAYRRVVDASRLKRFGKEFIDLAELQKKARQCASRKTFWLGKGFPWTDIEANKLHALLSLGVVRTIGQAAQHTDGAYWVHGLAPEADLYSELSQLVGHTLIVGTTRVGKTRLFDLLIAQAIFRGETVIIIDPKGDHALARNARAACEASGAGERFVYFHPAHPDRSACIDPLRNWNRKTELASRVAALIPSETGADPFTAFGWKVLNDITNGMIAIGHRPNLVQLRRYVEGGPDGLLQRALKAHFTRHVKDWESRAAPSLKRHRDRVLEAYLGFYREIAVHEARSVELDGLISTYEHNREHFQKMVASLIPILSMLTSEPLQELLSPDFEPGHERLVTDMSKIIHGHKVVYIGLDSLADATVGSAIGSILLADLAAVAGRPLQLRHRLAGAGQSVHRRSRRGAQPAGHSADEQGGRGGFPGHHRDTDLCRFRQPARRREQGPPGARQHQPQDRPARPRLRDAEIPRRRHAADQGPLDGAALRAPGRPPGSGRIHGVVPGTDPGGGGRTLSGGDARGTATASLPGASVGRADPQGTDSDPGGSRMNGARRDTAASTFVAVALVLGIAVVWALIPPAAIRSAWVAERAGVYAVAGAGEGALFGRTLDDLEGSWRATFGIARRRSLDPPGALGSRWILRLAAGPGRRHLAVGRADRVSPASADGMAVAGHAADDGGVPGRPVRARDPEIRLRRAESDPAQSRGAGALDRSDRARGLADRAAADARTPAALADPRHRVCPVVVGQQPAEEAVTTFRERPPWTPAAGQDGRSPWPDICLAGRCHRKYLSASMRDRSELRIRPGRWRRPTGAIDFRSIERRLQAAKRTGVRAHGRRP